MAKNLKSTSKKAPLVSVVMSVYNCEKYVGAAIDSILNQTLSDFELIVINDGSTDSTLNIVRQYKDPRIILVSRENKGLVASLNEGISIARGKYIARQDGDDLSEHARLAKQLALIQCRPELAIIGGSIRVFREHNQVIGDHMAIIGPDALKEEMCLRGPFAHGTAFGRASIFKAFGYRAEMWPAEDYDLWVRVAGRYQLGNVPDVIYRYRDNEAGISSVNASLQELNRRRIAAAFRESTYSREKAVPRLGLLLAEERTQGAKRRIIQNRIALIIMRVIPKRYIIDYIATKLGSIKYEK